MVAKVPKGHTMFLERGRCKHQGEKERVEMKDTYCMDKFQKKRKEKNLREEKLKTTELKKWKKGEWFCSTLGLD